MNEHLNTGHEVSASWQLRITSQRQVRTETMLWKQSCLRVLHCSVDSELQSLDSRPSVLRNYRLQYFGLTMESQFASVAGCLVADGDRNTSPLTPVSWFWVLVHQRKLMVRLWVKEKVSCWIIPLLCHSHTSSAPMQDKERPILCCFSYRVSKKFQVLTYRTMLLRNSFERAMNISVYFSMPDCQSRGDEFKFPSGQNSISKFLFR